jgi:hypothetical protein
MPKKIETFACEFCANGIEYTHNSEALVEGHERNVHRMQILRGAEFWLNQVKDMRSSEAPDKILSDRSVPKLVRAEVLSRINNSRLSNR